MKEVYNYTIPSLSKFNVIGQFWIHNIFIRICIEVVKLVLTEFLIFTHMVHFMALSKLFFFLISTVLYCGHKGDPNLLWIAALFQLWSHIKQKDRLKTGIAVLVTGS